MASIRPLLLWGVQVLSERYLDRPLRDVLQQDITANADRIRQALSRVGPVDRLWRVSYRTDTPLEPLRSIFADLCLVREQKQELADVYLFPRADFADPAYPRTYRALQEDAGFSEWKVKLKTALDRVGTDCSDEYLLTFLLRFGACVPVIDEKNCALSLYDFLKPAAALAACLTEDGAGAGWRLVQGDLSGIQDFLYTTSTRWALKTLRGGSFYMEMLVRHLALDVVSLYELRSCNVLYAGGGKFLVLLPDSGELDGALAGIRGRINTSLLQMFEGRLHLALASVPLTASDLKEPGIFPIWEDLNLRTTREKRRAFHQAIVEEAPGSQKTAFSTIRAQERKTEACQVCQRDSGPLQDFQGRTLCPFHGELIKAGRNFWRYRFILGLGSRSQDQRFGNLEMPSLRGDSAVYYTVAETEAEIREIEKGSEIVYRFLVNDPDAILNADGSTSLLPAFCENYVAVEDSVAGLAAPFEWMADRAVGEDMIGLLRMDVDNLGILFTDGLQSTPAGGFSGLCRIPALSRSLEYFFKFHLNGICAGNLGEGVVQERPLRELMAAEHPIDARRNVSIIYAGGDDLVIAGAWNEVAELAFDIEACFRQYVCGNRDVGISAGLVIHQPDYPVYLAAREARDAEGRSKANLELIEEGVRPVGSPIYEKRDREAYLARKNSITFFYDAETDRESRTLREQYERGHLGEEADRIPIALKWGEARRYVLEPLGEILQPTLAAYEPGPHLDGGRVTLKIPRQFISKLYETVQEWQTSEQGILYVPGLIYHGARTLRGLPQDQMRDAKRIIDRYRPYRTAPDDPIQIRYLRLVLNWLELLIRRKGERSRV